MSLEAIGAGLQEVLGQPFHDTPWFASSDEVRQDVRTSVAHVAAGQAVLSELTLELPNGKRSFDFAMRPIHGSNGSVVGIIAEATGYAGPVVRAEFLDTGMDMIAKPFTLDAFAVKVRDMLEDGNA